MEGKNTIRNEIGSKEKEPVRRILKGMPEYFDSIEENKEREKNESVRYAMLNLPSTCVLRCTKCARYDAREAAEFESASPLTLEEQKKFLDFTFEIGAREMVIVGEGEPTQANNWKKLYEPIIEYAHEKGMGTDLFTTAFFLTKTQAEFCRDHNVTVIVSLDSLENDRYYHLYGIDKWGEGNIFEQAAKAEIKTPADHVKKRIEMLADVYKGTESVSKDGRQITRLGINTTISLANEGELDDLRRFAHEHDMYFVANYLMKEGRAGSKYENYAELVGDDENWERHQRLAQEFSDSGGHSSIEGGVCNYFGDGIACDSRGYLLTCGYASATAHESENFRQIQKVEELLLLVERNRKAYHLWSEAIGRTPSCPLRDEDYAGFVEWVNKERLMDRFIYTEDKQERIAIVEAHRQFASSKT